MAMRFDFRRVSEEVMSILEADHDRSWSVKGLTDEVKKRTGLNNIHRVRGMVAALGVSGIARVRFTLSGEPTLVTWAEPSSNGECASCEALVRRLERVQLESYESEEKLAAAEAECQRLLDASKAACTQERVVEVRLVDAKGKVVKTVKDTYHAQFERVLTLARARMNIFIYGPTGCGKSHLCEQIATALGMRFAFVSCTAGMSEGVLGGRLLPTGKAGSFEYVISEFVRCYEEGGVFLLDEIDAADANVLLVINAALANGSMSVPNRPAKPIANRHPDFICVAAANTLGTGADRQYPGRNKLDGATLDRFQIGKVYMGYDDTVEAFLCPDDGLRARLTKYREAINAHRLERAMSTRFMRDAYRMKTDFGWDIAQIDEAFFQGWRDDEVNKVREYCR